RARSWAEFSLATRRRSMRGTRMVKRPALPVSRRAEVTPSRHQGSQEAGRFGQGWEAIAGRWVQSSFRQARQSSMVVVILFEEGGIRESCNCENTRNVGRGFQPRR